MRCGCWRWGAICPFSISNKVGGDLSGKAKRGEGRYPHMYYLREKYIRTTYVRNSREEEKREASLLASSLMMAGEHFGESVVCLGSY